MKTITVTKRGQIYEAELEGDSFCSGFGDTVPGAIGSLVMMIPADFRIVIVLEKPTQSAEGK